MRLSRMIEHIKPLVRPKSDQQFSHSLSGILTDSSASTSPKIMQEGWAKLVQWLNGHQHTNGNNGQDTGGPTSQFNGSITE